MQCAYENCVNLTTAVCGPNVIDMRNAYSGCYDFSIYVPANSRAVDRLFYANTYGLNSITFTNSGNEAYNAAYNIRLYFT